MSKFIKYNKILWNVRKQYMKDLIIFQIGMLIFGITMVKLVSWMLIIPSLVPTSAYFLLYFTEWKPQLDDYFRRESIEKRNKLMYNQFMKQSYH